MLDTMTIRGAWPLRQTLPARQKVSPAPGVRIWADVTGRGLERAECSLARVLFGHNGKVLADQAQLDAALAKLNDVLNSVAEVPSEAEWTPWRLDLVWNFNLQARPLVLAHAALRVPGIQSEGTIFPGGYGVSWRGAKSGFIVTLYDKARKMHLPSSVLRAEISMRGQQLARRLAGRDWRDFLALYLTYRGIMAGIPSIQKPTEAAGWPEAVGQESSEIRRRILARLAHKPTGTFRRYRRRTEAAAAQLPESFSWANILPVNGPPLAVHCEPRNRNNSATQSGGSPKS